MGFFWIAVRGVELVVCVISYYISRFFGKDRLFGVGDYTTSEESGSDRSHSPLLESVTRI